MRLPLLTIIYCLPLAAVLIMFAIPARRQLAIKTVALCASVAALGLTVWLFFAYDRGAGGLQLVERAPWLGVLGISYFVAVNGINVMLLLLTGIIVTAGVLASWNVTERSKEFFILLLTLATGVFGVFMAYNLFLFFLFYELAVLPMYLLIGIWGTGRKEYAAMKLTLYLMAGSALILAGILGLYFASGQGSFDFDVLEKTGFDPGFQRIFFPDPLRRLRNPRGAVAVAHVVPGWPLLRAHRGLDAPRGGPHEAGRLRLSFRPDDSPARRGALLASRGGTPVHRQYRLRLPGGGGAERPQVHRGLFQRQPHGHRDAGPLRDERDRHRRRGAPDVLPRHHDGPLLRPCGHDLRTDAHAHGGRAGRPGGADAGPGCVLRPHRAHLAGSARPERFPGGALRVPRRFPRLPGGDGDLRHRAS